MAYIGRTPTGSILTSADIADGSISTAKLADTAVSTAKLANDAVDNTKLDLTSNYAFTGTVTGANTLVKLHSITASSGDADVVFDSTYLTSDYDVYRIYLKAVRPVTDQTRLLARFSFDNGSSFISSGYTKVSFEGHEGTASDVINSRFSSSASSMNLNGSSSTQGNAIDEGTSGVIEFFNNTSDYKRLQTFLTWHFAGNQTATAQSSHELKSNRTSRANAIQFRQNNGNFESGTFTLYGVKDA